MQVLFPLTEAANQGGRLFCEFARDMFVQASVVVLILMLLDYVLRSRFRVSASLRYALWLLVLVKLVLPPSLAVPTGIGYWLGGDSPPDLVMPSENMSAVWEPAAEATVSAGPSLEPAQVRLDWQGVLCLLWLGMVTWLLLLLIRRHVVLRREIRRAQVAPEAVVNCVAACCATLGLRRPIGVRLSATVRGPVVCGLWHPVILLPASLPERLSPEGLKAVLGHELIHVERRDAWVHLAQSLLQILYFYHPLVWLANGMIRRVRELAVDETVLAAFKIKVTDYANALIDVAEMAYQKPAWDARLIGLAESKESLKRRITHMFERKSYGRVRLGWLGAMVIVAIGALLIPMGQSEPAASASKATAKTLVTAPVNGPALPKGIAELFWLTPERVVKRLGKPKDILCGDQHYTWGEDLPDGYSMVYDDLSLSIDYREVLSVTLRDKEHVLGNGIRVGDGYEKIAEALGPDFELREDGSKVFLCYKGLGIRFQFDKADRIAREIRIWRGYAFAEELAARVARLDIDASGPRELIRIFGEPKKYGGNNKIHQADELPRWYIMTYPSGFSFCIEDDEIVEMHHGDRSPYVFDNGLRIGLSPEEVFDCVGRPVDIVRGKNEYNRKVLYMDIDGKRGHGYYYLPDQQLRLWFGDGKLVGIYKTCSNYSDYGDTH